MKRSNQKRSLSSLFLGAVIVIAGIATTTSAQADDAIYKPSQPVSPISPINPLKPIRPVTRNHGVCPAWGCTGPKSRVVKLASPAAPSSREPASVSAPHAPAYQDDLQDSKPAAAR